jgi:hypothetical protein
VALARDVSWPPTRLTIPDVVGRAGELACLRSALAGARDGRGAAVFLVGEPGLGKTRRRIPRCPASGACWRASCGSGPATPTRLVEARDAARAAGALVTALDIVAELAVVQLTRALIQGNVASALNAISVTGNRLVAAGWRAGVPNQRPAVLLGRIGA